MTEQRKESKYVPWALVGGVGCLVLCLVLVLVGGGTYLLFGSTRATPVADGRLTPSPMLRATTPLSPGHFDNDEFSFDYPATWQTFADFWPVAFGFPYKPSHNLELDADELGGVLLPFASKTPGVTDRFLTSVTIYRRLLPAASSLQEIYERTYSGGYPKSNSISDKTVTMDGVTALEKMYRKPSGEPWYQVREVWLEKSGKIYILSCWTIPSNFDAIQPDFDFIIDSFHVK